MRLRRCEAYTYRKHGRLHGHKHAKPERKPRLRIQECFFELGDREVSLVAALAILNHAKREYILLSGIEKPGIIRAVWHEQIEQDACGGSQGAAHKEHYPPWRDREGTILTNAVHEQATNNLRQAVHGDPQAAKILELGPLRSRRGGGNLRCTGSMFLLAIPDGGDRYKRWRYSAFGEPEEKAHRRESSEVLRSCQAHADGTPDDTERVQVSVVIQAEEWADCIHTDSNKLGKMQLTH